MIRFENVTKRYKNAKVLKNISLEIKKGDFVVFIGESGCGKTTTLKMINRLIRPSSGKVYIGGEDIEKKDRITLRRNMGYVIQQTGLFPHMTIRDNIEIILKIEKTDPDIIRKKTYELMDLVGLDPDEYLDRYPSELSGGQQQRIGVARAFANDPDIILMDEPFSALDPMTRENLQDELIELHQKLKKTIIFVTHDMDEAIKIADKICIMKDGHILQYDTSENILKNPNNEFVTEFVGKQRIWASPELIKAEDIMIKSPVSCSAHASLKSCMDRMRKQKVDSLMVIENKSKKLLGIIRPKQIRMQGDHMQEVSNIMITDILSVGPEDTIIDILNVVEEEDISNIPVVGEEGKLLGLITKSSLVTTLSHQYIDTEGELI